MMNHGTMMNIKPIKSFMNCFMRPPMLKPRLCGKAIYMSILLKDDEVQDYSPASMYEYMTPYM